MIQKKNIPKIKIPSNRRIGNGNSIFHNNRPFRIFFRQISQPIFNIYNIPKNSVKSTHLKFYPCGKRKSYFLKARQLRTKIYVKLGFSKFKLDLKKKYIENGTTRKLQPRRLNEFG